MNNEMRFTDIEKYVDEMKTAVDNAAATETRKKVTAALASYIPTSVNEAIRMHKHFYHEECEFWEKYNTTGIHLYAELAMFFSDMATKLSKER